MAYEAYTQEQLERANSVDLAVYLENRGEKLLRSGRDRRIASDKSITIRGSRWYDHASEEGGGAISFLQDYYDRSFRDAVDELLGGEQGKALPQAPPKVQMERKPFALPEPHANMQRVYGYLIGTRHITQAVVSHFAHAHTLYEDAQYHNAVFVGLDEHGEPWHAHKRSTNSYGESFKINVESCDPTYSFHHIGTDNQLFVFEAPIDMLSYITLHPDNWQQHSYVCLCGVSEHAVVRQLELHPNLQHINLCLDHDAAGIENNQKLCDIIAAKGYTDINILQPQYKDWNEDLKAEHGIEPIPAEESPQLQACAELCSKLPEQLTVMRSEDCSYKMLQRLFGEYVKQQPCADSYRHSCLGKLTVLATVAAARQYKQLGVSVTAQDMADTLVYKFKPYQNRGKSRRRTEELGAALVDCASLQGVVTQDDKLRLAGCYETLALCGLRAQVTAVVEEARQERVLNLVQSM